MTTSLDIIRYHSGIAGEEVADMVDSLEQEVSTLREQVKKLEALVVMRCDLDVPPQFSQGLQSHEFLEPVTAEHCQWFVAKIEKLTKERDAGIAQGIEGPHHYRQNNVKLRQELAEISAALDDPRSDLTMTMPEIIKDLRDRVQHQAALIEKFHFAIESMRVAGGHVEFQAAFDRAKELLHSNEIVTAIDILGRHT